MNRRRWNTVFTLLGATVFAAYLVYTNPFKVLVELNGFNLRVFVAAVLVNYVGLFFLAASWHVILGVLGVRLSVWRSIQMTFVSLFAVWVLPIPSGVEIVRAYLVKDEEGSSIGKAVSSVVISKAYYFTAFGALITLAAVMVTMVQGSAIPVDARYVWFVVAYAILNTLVFGVVMTPKALLYIYDKSPARVRKHLLDRIYRDRSSLDGFERFVGEVGAALKSLRASPGLNLLSLLLVAFHWSTGSITAYMVALSLGYQISFWVIVLIYAVVEFIQQLNVVIPGGLGVVDVGLAGAFVVVGVPLSVASAISLLTRLATYWFELILCGLVSFQYGYREALKNL